MTHADELPQFFWRALRTGELPTPTEIASWRADHSSGFTTQNIHINESCCESRYRRLVDELISDWLDDNPHFGAFVPTDIRRQIELDCRERIERLRARDGDGR
jgi:hypothetical protein